MMWIKRNGTFGQTAFSSFLIWLSAAVGYFRMVIGGVEIYLRIPSEFDVHDLLPCFGFL
jgi:succinate-acetate transporter protein